MDIKAYMEQVYRWLQQFYTPEKLEGPVARIYNWLLDLSWARIINLVVGIVILAVIVDLILYWTRTDQVSLIRRLWRGLVKLWNRIAVKPQRDTEE